MRDRDLTVVVVTSCPVGAPAYGPEVASRESPIERLAGAGLTRPDPEVLVTVDSHLHGDDDSICPRCLRWIEGRDYVRRNAYGLLQHEVCPD